MGFSLEMAKSTLAGEFSAIFRNQNRWKPRIARVSVLAIFKEGPQFLSMLLKVDFTKNQFFSKNSLHRGSTSFRPGTWTELNLVIVILREQSTVFLVMVGDHLPGDYKWLPKKLFNSICCLRPLRRRTTALRKIQLYLYICASGFTCESCLLSA